MEVEFLSRRESFEVVRFSVQSLASLCSGWLLAVLRTHTAKHLPAEPPFSFAHFYLIHCCHTAPSLLVTTHFTADPVISVILTGMVAGWLLCSHEAEAGGSQNLGLAWST